MKNVLYVLLRKNLGSLIILLEKGQSTMLWFMGLVSI